MPIRGRHKSKKFLLGYFAVALVIVLWNLVPGDFCKKCSAQMQASTVIDDRPYVILLRHGEAPGRGEPANFDLNDCSTQRNLSDKGREEAKALGEKLRALNVNVTKVIASRWCRAKETAQLLNFGHVEESRAFDNSDLNKSRAQTLLENERALIASWRGPGVLAVVTHSSNLKALTAIVPGEGSVITVQPNEKDELDSIAQVDLRKPLDLMLF